MKFSPTDTRPAPHALTLTTLAAGVAIGMKVRT